MTNCSLSICVAVALSAIGMVGLGPAKSQEAEMPGAGAPLETVGQDGELRDVESMIGIPVFNALDEEIAEIQGLFASGNRLVYARLSLGGFLFFGGEEMTVPFSVLSFRESAPPGEEASLEAVIETVRTTDQLRKLLGNPIDAAGATGE